MKKNMRPEDKVALDKSLADAYKIARRLSRCSDSQAHSVALEFIRKLIKLGAELKDEEG